MGEGKQTDLRLTPLCLPTQHHLCGSNCVPAQVALPLDPGVVLLDIAFTGSNPDHGRLNLPILLAGKEPAL